MSADGDVMQNDPDSHGRKPVGFPIPIPIPAQSGILGEWCAVLFIVATPLIVAALLLLWIMGDAAATAITGTDHAMRAVQGLATVLPPLTAMLYILHLRRVPFPHVGLGGAPCWRSLLEGLVLFALAVGLLWFFVLRHQGDALWNALCGDGDPLIPITPPAPSPISVDPQPSPIIVIIGIVGMILFAFANGVFEEVFRGYVMARTGDACWPAASPRLRLIPGAVLSVALFVAYHAYHPEQHRYWLAAIAVLFALHFLWRRDTIALIVAHVGLDLLTFFLNDALRVG
jgi:hypothetical protein